MLPKCDRFKKVTVLTDPDNPEDDLIKQATDKGEVVHVEHCEDGFVYLIKLAEEDSFDLPPVCNVEIKECDSCQ